jgi:iron-sulfur cluster assembly accessory protein
MNVTVTPAAEKFMRRMVRFGGGGAAAGFRLKVSPGGCSGLASEFTVEAAPLAGDAVLDVNGVKVFLPAESRILLTGMTIDFTDTMLEAGLKFTNPSAPATSCGSHASEAPPGFATIDVATIRRKT